MVSSVARKKFTLAIVIYLIILLTTKTRVLGKSSGSMSSLCCNKRGHCGVGNEYCGRECKEGPCYAKLSSNRVLVMDIVTDVFFNRFEEHVNGSCEEKGLYSRDSFFNVTASYPKFGMVGTVDNSKREIAAYFAHFTHDARDICNSSVQYINAEPDSCDKKNTAYPCNPGGGDYWETSSKVSSEQTSDGLKTDPVLSFNTTLKFWMKNCHDSILSGRGFGATIRAINGKHECNGANPRSVAARVQYYKDYCNQLRVDPGTKLRC